MERPGPAFVALRAATLAVDDLSRQVLREWIASGFDLHGERLEEYPAPVEPASSAIVAGMMTVAPAERVRFRHWVLRWTDYSGRLITPNENAARVERLRLEYEARDPASRWLGGRDGNRKGPPRDP